ncbi:MAG: NAD(P)H-binding protein [Alphaproteobacteria bacterium]|nr:NAD(P)H-binding protein [Alphaproteobacteria bacterium]
MQGAVVVAGATGFVGARLVAALTSAGVPVRCGSRSPDSARRRWPDRSWVALDVDRIDTVRAALDGARAYVHLVHHMATDAGDLVGAEVRSAEAVARACADAGVGRIVYLGAPVPEGSPSEHLIARARTGEALAGGTVPVVELRASMIVGHGSESWLIVRDLAHRLPVMVLPAWLRSRTQPVAVDDVVTALAAAISSDAVPAGIHDLPGPEVLSAEQILRRTAGVLGMRPVTVPVPVLTPALSSAWIKLVTRADFRIARKLVDGLTDDLLLDEPGVWAHLPDAVRTGFDDGVRRAIAEEPPQTGGGATWERWARRLARPAR